ncbi:hypothetical protein [Promicromonospora sp. NPDC090134]
MALDARIAGALDGLVVLPAAAGSTASDPTDDKIAVPPQSREVAA